MHKLIYCLSFLCAAVGCEATQSMHEEFLSSAKKQEERTQKEETQILEEFNKNELSKGGKEIGTLPDGRKVVLYRVYSNYWYGCLRNEHYIYVVNGSNTVNRSFQTGKNNTKKEVNTLIDGIDEESEPITSSSKKRKKN
jgi:hypothetical protein